MPEFAAWYPQIKQAHMGLALASGLLFAARGALVLAGRSWAMHRPWRMVSYVIDTLLLAAGVTLWTVLSIDLAESPWLAVKLLLLVVYVVLGSLALKRARTRQARVVSYVAALAVYGAIASVAVAHHPLGWLGGLKAHAG